MQIERGHLKTTEVSVKDTASYVTTYWCHRSIRGSGAPCVLAPTSSGRTFTANTRSIFPTQMEKLTLPITIQFLDKALSGHTECAKDPITHFFNNQETDPGVHLKEFLNQEITIKPCRILILPVVLSDKQI